MYIQCEYCGAIKDNLTNTCRNCGGVARRYVNADNKTNKLLSLLHRRKLYFIIGAILSCLVIAFSYYAKERDQIMLGVSAFRTSSDKPPELWSWIKDLNKSKDACLFQSNYVLKSLKLENKNETKYGIYGTIKNNRVVVKCISITSVSSKLLVAVAGYDKHSVELVRNIIIKKIN